MSRERAENIHKCAHTHTHTAMAAAVPAAYVPLPAASCPEIDSYPQSQASHNQDILRTVIPHSDYFGGTGFNFFQST